MGEIPLASHRVTRRNPCVFAGQGTSSFPAGGFSGGWKFLDRTKAAGVGLRMGASIQILAIRCVQLRVIQRPIHQQKKKATAHR